MQSSNLTSIIQAFAESVTAFTAVISSIAFFHYPPYKITETFDISSKTDSFNNMIINVINERKKPISLKFIGILPTKKDIKHRFMTRKIKYVKPDILYIRKNSKESNKICKYSNNYMNYFNKLVCIPSYGNITIKIPLRYLIGISKYNKRWHNILSNELFLKNKITFIILFERVNRKQILKRISLKPGSNKFITNTFNKFQKQSHLLFN